MIELHAAEEFTEAAGRIVAAVRRRIAPLLPAHELVFTGGSSVPGALTKGDIDLHLRLARGDEAFRPLGAEADEPPEPGEVVYADDAKVLCRRWSWRQGEASKISAATTRAVLNVHGLPPAERDEVARATETLAGLVGRVCGGESRRYVLDADSPSAQTEIPDEAVGGRR